MDSRTDIDITFDFRFDTPKGKDPDAVSPTLRRYHQLLWSKPLPGGVVFKLGDTTPGVYLHHKSEVGEFRLSSDAVIPTFSSAERLSGILDQIPKGEVDKFNRICYTIGGMPLFPQNRIGRGITLNGARGFHPRIKDRFDLNLECIRRHYGNAQSNSSRRATAGFSGHAADLDPRCPTHRRCVPRNGTAATSRHRDRRCCIQF